MIGRIRATLAARRLVSPLLACLGRCGFSVDNYMKSYSPEMVTVTHGRMRVDEHATLFDSDQKIQVFVESERKLYTEQSSKWQNRAQSYLERVNLRRDQRAQSTPEIINGYEYYTQVAWFEGREYAQIWRRPVNSASGKSQLVLDIMKYHSIRAYHKTVELTRTVFSNCSNFLAFGLDLNNNEETCFMVKNIKEDHIVGIKGWQGNRLIGADNLVFHEDRGIFYTKVLLYRPCQLWYQNIKTGQTQLIYEEKDARHYLDIAMAKDGQHLIVSANSNEESKIWAIDTRAQGQFRMNQFNTGKDTKLWVNHNGADFVLWRRSKSKSEICLINDGNFMQQVPVYTVDPASYETITDIDIIQNYIILYLSKMVTPLIRILELKGHRQPPNVFEVPMPYGFGKVQPGANQMLHTDLFLFYINNLFVYNEGYEYNLKDRKLIIKQEFKMTGPKFNPRDYIVTLHEVPAEDGELIPLSTIVSKKQAHTRTKMLLHVYGHYGLSYELSFNNTYWAALEEGWSLAYAHVRGGAQKGTYWHRSAVRERKDRNWKDLEECAAFLIRHEYTHPSILVLLSHSAGAITVWNSINRYPHLFKAVVMSYPFLDVMGALLDSSKPLSQTDYAQFGNPINSIMQYNVIESLSPYQNIEGDKNYPFVYLVAGTQDYRCPMEQVARFVTKYRQRGAARPEESRVREDMGRAGLLVKVNEASHEGIAHLGDQLRDGCQMLACLDYVLEQASTDVKFL